MKKIKKIVSFIIALSFLMSGNAVLVKADAVTKYIKDDGTGGDCASFGTWDNTTKTCTMIADAPGGVVITGNGITLDANNHNLPGGGTEPAGVTITDFTNVIVKNGNVISDILIRRGASFTIQNNNITKGIKAISASSGNITNNKISAGSIILENSGSVILIKDNEISNTDDWGIKLYRANDNTIETNDIGNHKYGIYVEESGHVRINGNTISGIKNDAIFFRDVSLSKITGNGIATNSGSAIFLKNSKLNVIDSNSIAKNAVAINLESSSRNSITSNIITYSLGIRLLSSGDNTIYNNLFNTTPSVSFEGDILSNSWNTSKTAGTNIVGGPNLGGNYWSDGAPMGFGKGFSDTCTDADKDGICDTAYKLNDKNIDNLPLAKKVSVDKIILDNATGGDCTFFGNWDNANKICTMTADVLANIEIASDGIVLDADGHTIPGQVGITSHSGITVKNGSIKSIVLGFGAKQNLIQNNNISEGLKIISSNNNTFENNKISGGLSFGESGNNIIRNNQITSGGIGFTRSVGDAIESNTITGSDIGIGADLAYNSLIKDNNINSNTTGIYLGETHDIKIINNTISRNDLGVSMGGTAQKHTIEGNKITDNNTAGIKIASAGGNTFDNNLFSNTANVLFEGTVASNIWNIAKTPGTNIVGGPNLGGNYWAKPDGTGFSETCTDADSDGICDTAYTLNDKNIDNFPLVKKSTVTEINSCTMISSPGTYVLSQDISASPSRCIEITSSDVVFDGAGHTIKGVSVLGGSYGVYVGNSSMPIKNVTVKNLTSSNWGYGIAYYNVNGGSIDSNNTISNIGNGIHLENASNNITISNNVANSNFNGIVVYESSATLNKNTFNFNKTGIQLYSANNNILINNSIKSNSGFGGGNGILIGYSSNNTLSSNTITDNSSNGIELIQSNSNLFYNNYLNNNTNVYDYGNSNIWNTSKTSGANIVGGPNLGGNYWANPSGTGFSETCTDTNSDGICDVSYTVSSGNIDNLPLAKVVSFGSYQGDYFNNTDLSGTPVLSRNEPYPINYDWGTGSPDPSVNSDNFSARYVGNFDFATADYNFFVTSDDGVRLYIDNNLILDKWIDQPATSYTVPKSMTGGTHQVKLEYYERYGQAVIKLSWGQTGLPAAPHHVQTSITPGVPKIGETALITTTITNNGGSTPFLVDIEVYNDGTRVGQQFYDNQIIPNGESHDFTMDWTPQSEGSYRIAVGLFKQGWEGLYEWNNNAKSFVITNQSPAVIYSDVLSLGWENWSWDTNVNFSATETVSSGSYSLSASYNAPWAGLYLHDGGVNTSGKSFITFDISGGSTGGQNLQIIALDQNSNILPPKNLNSYIFSGSISTSWQQVNVPLGDLGIANTIFTGFIIQGASGSIEKKFYLDNIVIR